MNAFRSHVLTRYSLVDYYCKQCASSLFVDGPKLADLVDLLVLWSQELMTVLVPSSQELMRIFRVASTDAQFPCSITSQDSHLCIHNQTMRHTYTHQFQGRLVKLMRSTKVSSQHELASRYIL